MMGRRVWNDLLCREGKTNERRPVWKDFELAKVKYSVEQKIRYLSVGHALRHRNSELCQVLRGAGHQILFAKLIPRHKRVGSLGSVDTRAPGLVGPWPHPGVGLGSQVRVSMCLTPLGGSRHSSTGICVLKRAFIVNCIVFQEIFALDGARGERFLRRAREISQRFQTSQRSGGVQDDQGVRRVLLLLEKLLQRRSPEF